MKKKAKTESEEQKYEGFSKLLQKHRNLALYQFQVLSVETLDVN
jgi:hypothetical protein